MPHLTPVFVNSPCCTAEAPSINDLDDNLSVEVQIRKMISKSKFPVYLASNTSQSKPFALKVFPFYKKSANPLYEIENRFDFLNHENVIKILSKERSTKINQRECPLEVSTIAYELAPYGNMSDLCFNKTQKSVLNEVLIRTLFKQLINGIEYMHEKQVAHLDIKLDNLMIGEDYKLKIIDFDSSYKVGDVAIISKGTSNFRPNELKDMKCRDPFKADIYSAGIVLFCMMFGHLPYSETARIDGRDLQEEMFANSKDFWQFHERISEKEASKEFKELFNMMIRSEPDQRASINEIKNSKWFNKIAYSLDKSQNMLKNLVKNHC